MVKKDKHSEKKHSKYAMVILTAAIVVIIVAAVILFQNGSFTGQAYSRGVSASTLLTTATKGYMAMSSPTVSDEEVFNLICRNDATKFDVTAYANSMNSPNLPTQFYEACSKGDQKTVKSLVDKVYASGFTSKDINDTAYTMIMSDAVNQHLYGIDSSAMKKIRLPFLSNAFMAEVKSQLQEMEKKGTPGMPGGASGASGGSLLPSSKKSSGKKGFGPLDSFKSCAANAAAGVKENKPAGGTAGGGTAGGATPEGMVDPEHKGTTEKGPTVGNPAPQKTAADAGYGGIFGAVDPAKACGYAGASGSSDFWKQEKEKYQNKAAEFKAQAENLREYAGTLEKQAEKEKNAGFEAKAEKLLADAKNNYESANALSKDAGESQKKADDALEKQLKEKEKSAKSSDQQKPSETKPKETAKAEVPKEEPKTEPKGGAKGMNPEGDTCGAASVGCANGGSDDSNGCKVWQANLGVKSQPTGPGGSATPCDNKGGGVPNIPGKFYTDPAAMGNINLMQLSAQAMVPIIN